MVKDGMVGDDLRDLKECKGQIRVFLAHTHTHTKKTSGGKRNNRVKKDS